MLRRALFLVPLFLGSPAPAATPNGLDGLAPQYVQLQLDIGEKEDGYIDAFYGPASFKTQAQANAKTTDLPSLQRRAESLLNRVNATVKENPARARFLAAQIHAAITRLKMLQGEKLSFDDEARGLFGLTPKLKPLSAYDPILARIERLVPGKGPLAERVDAFQDRFVINTERLKPVFDAAIAGCKARTERHIRLPKGERFDLAFVTGKSWSGYNYYQGHYTSRIEVNTDLPIRISRAVDLGCHEGYPGHHVLNSLLEQKLERGRGWIEFSVYPLFSPQSVIAEGSANYGINLAFPGPQKLAFETSALYPRAGLPTRDAARYSALLKAMKDLAGARMTIAREFLDGRISEAQAVELTRHYQLTSEARAKQSIAFTKQYRTYVLNYGLGEQMVREDVESRRGTAARWRRFEQIISEPTLPANLKASR
jgi:hypothetical protein